MRGKKGIYALYDTKDNDLCVVVGDWKECCDFAKCERHLLTACKNKKLLLKKRYKVERVKDV